MKYSQLHKKLLEAGCYIIRNRGGHPVWRSPITGCSFETGNHQSEEVKIGTLRKIEKLSGVKF